MEDMARLALVEQSVRDDEKFSKILYELLWHINHILENPHDYELRAIKSDSLKNLLRYDAFVDYLKSIGFQSVGNEYTYPKEHALSKLRMAQAAIERKIYFCCGSLSRKETKIKSASSPTVAKKPKLQPVHVLTTRNSFLLQLQSHFNEVLKYEDEELQQQARDVIPIVTLQLMALDRCREQQRKIKSGEIKGHDLPFDIALLMELLGWFKYKFFSWVDRPPCERCGANTEHARNETATVDGEYCRVEVYVCAACGAGGGARFARHNDVRRVLRARRGRCGEWANCFALLCRALGYDTRHVVDTTDHVWCEVFDFDSNTWLHVDPCEAKLNAPLLYSHGWGKRLSYVVAFSRDDLQDVTWRYTTEHKEVLKRRGLCSEAELVDALLSLRHHRQCALSDSRRRCLAKRCLEELTQMMVEKKPSDYESHGRISGSEQWRRERGENGDELAAGHTFTVSAAGVFCVSYNAAGDAYSAPHSALAGWAAGAYRARRLFRKEEQDWKMVYLAREEGSTTGSISWKLCAAAGLALRAVRLRLGLLLCEDGAATVTVTRDQRAPVAFTWTSKEESKIVCDECTSVVVEVRLSGGRGEQAWQHAQLARQALADAAPALEIQAIAFEK